MSRNPISRETSPPRTGARCLALLVAGLLLIAGAAVGCGESDEEKAQTQVCDARADLKKQVDDLAGLTTGCGRGGKQLASSYQQTFAQIDCDCRRDGSAPRPQRADTRRVIRKARSSGAESRS